MRADRLAVVAELGVVVVLDDDPAAPVAQSTARPARSRWQDGAGRVLVGRR